MSITEKTAGSTSDTLETHTYHDRYYNPAELAARILEETPEAIDAFDSLEELIADIREAMAADYVYSPEPLPQG